MAAQFYFKKPEIIVQEPVPQEQAALHYSREAFLNWFATDIEQRASYYGVQLQLARVQDLRILRTFVEEYYTKLEGNSLSPYDYYRIIEYGHAIMMWEQETLIGCIFEMGYDNFERNSYALRLVLSSNVRGRGYAQLLTDYTCYLGYLRGSTVVRATIAINNLVSLFFHLNKVGMILETINPDIDGLTRYYQASLPLSPEGILTNRIDRLKLASFLQNSREGKDFIRLQHTQLAEIEHMFATTNFKIVAFEPIGSRQYEFIAIPAPDLQYFTTRQFD